MARTAQQNSRRVIVLGTGGTISGRAAAVGDNIGYVAGQLRVTELLGDVAAPEGVALQAEQVAQVDSKDMTSAIWLALAQRCAHWLAESDVAGIVITHGTDTLEETAFFLQQVLGPSKPVVVTCAMRPASALSPDGPQNMRDAIAVAACVGARGVVAVCAGTVHSAFDVQKVHTYRTDAFSSADAGPVAFVEEGSLRILRSWPTGSIAGEPSLLDRLAGTSQWPRVEIVMSHAGASGSLIDALVAERRSGAAEAVQGLVLAATGNGSLHVTLEAAALRAQAAGIAVVRATRCGQGRILPKPDDPLPHAGALTPVKARIALMLDLMAAHPARD